MGKLFDDLKVKRYRLDKLVKIVTGKNILVNKLAKVNCFPVISGTKEPLGYGNVASHFEPTITVSHNGSAGYVSWQDEPFYLNDVAIAFVD